MTSSDRMQWRNGKERARQHYDDGAEIQRGSGCYEAGEERVCCGKPAGNPRSFNRFGRTFLGRPLATLANRELPVLEHDCGASRVLQHQF
jgi:hypothetical protein